MNQEQLIKKVIEETTKRLKDKQENLIFDNTPTENSDNLVTSDGVKKYIDAKPDGGSVIVANPKISGNEDNLVGIQVGKDKYKIKEGTQVEPIFIIDQNAPLVKTMQIDDKKYIVKDDNVSTVIPKSVKSELNKFTDTWEVKSWTGLTYARGEYIWSDGENIYYSEGTTQYVLNKLTLSWTAKGWSGLTNFYGNSIWTDGENIYCSSLDIYSTAHHYVLNKVTSTWSQKTWYGLTNFTAGNIWTDGESVYYSNIGNNYVLDKSTSTWSQKTWYGFTNISGYEIWTDGDDIYFSNANNHYVLDKLYGTWNKKVWNGLNFFYSTSIWTDGDDIYYSMELGGINYQYVLDKETSTWLPKSWNGLVEVNGDHIWTDGDNIYYSNQTNQQYILKKNTLSQTKPVLSDDLTVKGNPELVGNEEELTGIQIEDNIYKMPDKPVVSDVIPKNTKIELDKFSSTWESKVWSGVNRFSGRYIWSDGDNIYYSDLNDQYVLDRKTDTWSPMTWVGLTNFLGTGIWTDGDNIYYSSSNTQYVLNKSNLSWEIKRWTNLTNINGNSIWTDGINIYYSDSNRQYVLNKTTSTWSRKTWAGLTSFYGSGIWTDGDNIYYSDGTTQYVLDKATSTWSEKTWTGLTNFEGNEIWTDEDNIYYSGGINKQYVLNKSTSTWIRKVWLNLNSFFSSGIWTDGDNIYYSNADDNSQYILKKNTILSDNCVLDLKIYANKTSVETLPRLYSLKIDDKNYKLTFNDLKVSNLTESSGILSWSAPDTTKYTDYTPNISYLIYINDTLIDETSNTSYDASAELTSGTYDIKVIVKVDLLNDEDKDITITV